MKFLASRLTQAQGAALQVGIRPSFKNRQHRDWVNLEAAKGAAKPPVYCVALLDKGYATGIRGINREVRLVN